MSIDLMLKTKCSLCGSTSDLYSSDCRHMTLCLTCGRSMAEKAGECLHCGAVVTRLLREYDVRASTSTDTNYFIGRFVTGLPSFAAEEKSENKWSLIKEGLQGCKQVTEALQEKYENRPWLLEDETGQFQYHGHLEGAESETYYLLMMQGKELVAIPAGSWYNFNKVSQNKQLTLEEAEEKMINRRKAAYGYESFTMAAANNGIFEFGEYDDMDDDDDDYDYVDHMDDDDDDDTKKGADWEHEEIFTDDDEAVGNHPEERGDLAHEVPVPPGINQDDDDEGGGLSKSGKELKKLLLGRANWLNDDTEDDDDDCSNDDDKEYENEEGQGLKLLLGHVVWLNDDDDMDDDIDLVVPQEKDEPAENSPLQPATSGSPSTSMSAKGKRKIDADE